MGGTMRKLVKWKQDIEDSLKEELPLWSRRSIRRIGNHFYWNKASMYEAMTEGDAWAIVMDD